MVLLCYSISAVLAKVLWWDAELKGKIRREHLIEKSSQLVQGYNPEYFCLCLFIWVNLRNNCFSGNIEILNINVDTVLIFLYFVAVYFVDRYL